jgi:hypothetical protein
MLHSIGPIHLMHSLGCIRFVASTWFYSIGCIYMGLYSWLHSLECIYWNRGLTTGSVYTIPSIRPPINMSGISEKFLSINELNKLESIILILNWSKQSGCDALEHSRQNIVYTIFCSLSFRWGWCGPSGGSCQRKVRELRAKLVLQFGQFLYIMRSLKAPAEAQLGLDIFTK